MALLLLCSELSGRMALLLLLLLSTIGSRVQSDAFEIDEATVDGLRAALNDGRLTSRRLVEHYIRRIESLNPRLRAVIEIDPDALRQADRSDRVRRRSELGRILEGIPVLLKDNIATRGRRLNTTAGSLALLGSAAPRDAEVARRLRRAGAVILGKASLSEWANFRSIGATNGWSARGGQGLNPYGERFDTCGSSSGSAMAVAANMVAVSVGTETDGSIICPSAANSVVGIKPTVGLTSRAGVIPISPRQDTVGPICRTVADAVAVLEAIVGHDARDSEATSAAMKYIPSGGYRQFLKADGMKGKRLGILRKEFFDFPVGSVEELTLEQHLRTMRRKGAILVDNLEIANLSIILDWEQSGEMMALLAEFKQSLNAYLSDLSESPVRSLADVIAFNNKHSTEERIADFGQDLFLMAEKTNGIGAEERAAVARMAGLSKEGLEKLMADERLDAVVAPSEGLATVLAIGGYPGITVPAGYGTLGAPFGIFFGGLKGSEPTLIQIAYAFEQATKVRRPPPLNEERGPMINGSTWEQESLP